MSPYSTFSHGGGSSVATEESVRGEYVEDSWVMCGVKAPLSWWFSDGVVPLSEISVGYILSG